MRVSCKSVVIDCRNKHVYSPGQRRTVDERQRSSKKIITVTEDVFMLKTNDAVKVNTKKINK